MTEAKRIAELERLSAMSEYERRYEAHGYVCGVDEAGRGPLAGPVVAAAVILPKDCQIFYLNDSKKLSEKRRESLFSEIREKAVSFGIGIVGEEVIDEVNILQATYMAMREAIGQLSQTPAHVLVDGNFTIPDLSLSQEAVVKGDAKSISIAAASILAKVTRDHIMIRMDGDYPVYGFAKHKGYGTAAHIAALREFGPCPIHRKSFIGHFT